MKQVNTRAACCFVAMLLLGLLGCSGGEREFTGPEEGDGGDEEPGLTVSVALRSEDLGLASTLGWEEGVPGATVHVLRNGTATWRTAETDGSGTVRFDNALDGLYRVYAQRTLTQGAAQAAGTKIRAFGDGRTLRISGPTETRLELYADSAGGLVISELMGSSPPPWETDGSYTDGMFLEVYNNSDKVLYMDGLVFGATHAFVSESEHTTCAESEALRTDSTGLYSRQMVQFPGSGSEYSIGPGETRVLAIVAIDHRSVHPQAPDLSDADFEVGSPDQADNPAVPNVRDVGLEPFVPGGYFPSPLISGLRGFFLARPLDVAALPQPWLDNQGRRWAKVPAESLIEVVSFRNLWPEQDLQYPPCIPFVHPRFDRYVGALEEIGLQVESDPELARQRRSLRTEEGRPLLMNTNTSMVDFTLGRFTPGSVP